MAPGPLRIAPYRVIAAEVAERLLGGRAGADPLAPWEEEVIAPSSGVVQAVTAHLIERLPNGIAGLQLQTLETLARRIVNAAGEFPRVASEGERRLAMRTAIRSIDHPMMESRGVASMLERSYRDVRDGGVTLSELSARARSARGLRNAERTRILLRAWTEYERLIALLGAIDPADLLARATALASSGANVRPQLLAGFYDMTVAQRKLVEALPVAAAWVPTDLPFARPLLSVVGDRLSGLRETELFAERSPDHRQPTTDNHTHDTRHDELRSVAEHAAELARSGARVGIVARSLEAYDARLLNRFAHELAFRTSLPDETPLVAHRVGRGVVTLLRLRERGFPRADVLELVRDGLRTQTKLNADAADYATRRARVAGGTADELRTLRNRKAILDDYLALVAELEELTATVDVDFLGRLSGLFRLETDLDLSAAETLDEIASLFRRAQAWNRPLDVPSVIDALEHATLEHRQPTTDTRPLIWAGDLLKFRGRSFDHLFVVRMQDDVFPQRRNEDPLLPDSDRHLLGLRLIGDGTDEERLLFQLLFDATSEAVHFSYASGDGFGKVIRSSRLLRSVVGCRLSVVGAPLGEHPREAETAAAPLGEHPREAEHRPPTTDHRPQLRQRPLQLLAKAGTRSVFDAYIPTIAPLVEAKLHALSPTQLEDFGECPQKFLLKHILGVEDLEHPEREIQVHHRDKGTLDHRVLERFYSGMTDDDRAAATASLPRLPDSLARRLDTLIDEAFDNHESEVPPFNRTVRGIERRATKRILREFVLTDLADLHASGLAPKYFEFQFGSQSARRPNPSAPSFTVNAGDVALRVEGTIDRIDLGEGGFRIVDYKSGKALRHNNLADKIDRGVRLQLALYAMAVAEIFGTGGASINGTIKPIVTADVKTKFEFSLQEKQERLLETLTLFIQAIRKGLFPAFPSRGDDFDSCKYCPVNHSCRTKHDLDERYAIQQQKDPRTLLAGGA